MHIASVDLVVHLTIMLAWIAALWMAFSYGAAFLERRGGPPAQR